MARAACGDENGSPAVKSLADQLCVERDGRMPNLCSMLLNALRAHFNTREIVELTSTIGGYNPVSRFVEALAVDPEQARA
jgi:alkylhydroperoxidase family enzyme